ncbi:hypothetical protein N8264_03225 [Candidatus Thioglobus sp.]|nr:hypothetical protein [Candidatus Thioglobus sp.]
MKKPMYIIYATTDGAGTHIIRSLFMELHDSGYAGPIDHSSFWAKAVAAKSHPEAFFFDQAKPNSTVFQELCASQQSSISTDKLDDKAIFDAFDKIYSNYPINLDFSRNFTSEAKIAEHWDQSCIESVQDMVVRYIKSKGKIDIKVLTQIRNPLDHMASFFERFKDDYTLDEIKNKIISNLSNIERFRKKLNETDVSNLIVNTTLDDLVLNYPKEREKISNLIGTQINPDFYTSTISLDKWYSCPEVFPYLLDDSLINAAEHVGYKYPILPKQLWFTHRIFGMLKRFSKEFKLAIDTARGKVNVFNSINTKHKIIITGTSFDRVLAGFMHLITRHHRSQYNKLLLKHNKKKV